MHYRSIDRDELRDKLSRQVIDNDDPHEGVALVNVLGPDAFDRKHIPGSINVPVDDVQQLEQRFGKTKEIIVYCASARCNASPRAAEALARQGFTRVADYAGGTEDWERANQPVAGRESTPAEVPS